MIQHVKNNISNVIEDQANWYRHDGSNSITRTIGASAIAMATRRHDQPQWGKTTTSCITTTPITILILQLISFIFD